MLYQKILISDDFDERIFKYTPDIQVDNKFDHAVKRVSPPINRYL